MYRPKLSRGGADDSMALKCIPLNLDWCDTTKQDFHAIYLRRKQDNWGVPTLDASGREQWDATGPLPMRRHSDWMKKGYQYLTLFIASDDHRWPLVAGWIRQTTGDDPATYIQNRRQRTTFDVGLWQLGAIGEREKELAALRAEVEQYGAETVLAIRQRVDPNFRLPADLYPADVTDEPVDQAPVASAPVTIKRGPGRPRKHEAVA